MSYECECSPIGLQLLWFHKTLKWQVEHSMTYMLRLRNKPSYDIVGCTILDIDVIVEDSEYRKR